ncbi:MAG TPA: TldD/PmbA family protein [Kofleriaceae bacterium]
MKPLVDRVLKRVPKGGETTVSLRSDRRGNTRFARGEITSSADVERFTVSVTVQFGKRSATATTNQTDDGALDEVVARAARMAKLAPENPETMAPLGKQTFLKAKASDVATVKLTPAARAKAVGAAIAAGDAAKLAIAGFYEHSATQRALATSAGLWVTHDSTQASFSCTARTADGTGSGWAESQSHRAADVDASALAKIAVEKASKSATPKKLDPGRYTVILEPAAVEGLLSFLIGSLGARRADEGRSFFAKPGGGTRIGEKLFPEFVTLSSDPIDAQTGGTPFDNEGVPLKPTKWIDKGKVEALIYGRYWASKQGKPATGSPTGWTLASGKATTPPAGVNPAGSIVGSELLKGVKRGVLITRFWYIRDLDPQTILTTGLTRDGTFLIENGAIAGPVNNFRFNESPIHMLAKCDAVGTPWLTDGMRVPALRTHEFNLASISEAV